MCSVSLAVVEIRIDSVAMVFDGKQMENSRLAVSLRLEMASFKAMNGF